MYITEVKLQNIKGHNKVSLDFTGREAGWHVILGDNGSGKTSLLRAIGLGLIGMNSAGALQVGPHDWIRKNRTEGEISLKVNKGKYDQHLLKKEIGDDFPGEIGLNLSLLPQGFIAVVPLGSKDAVENGPWESPLGWFSSGFGSFRRLFDGDQELQRIYDSHPKAAAHLSLFRESSPLRNSLSWLRELHARRLEHPDGPEGKLLQWFIQFFNSSDLLSKGIFIKEVTLDGVLFVDANDETITAKLLSDGFNSMVSLTFEMMRRMIEVYGVDITFENWNQNEGTIGLSGVVLIDEVDVHLHPTWQTRIGDWFTTYFPKMQFIVTTHSPFICRGAANGTIWKLPAPGTAETAGQIIGPEKDKLIYGNILDAFETDEFGEGISRGTEGKAKQKRYYDLMMKRRFDTPMTAAEKKELRELQILFQSNVED